MERWVEEIEGWEERAFSGGFGGLRDLADVEFSGAVTSGDAWLYMVNGTVVSVVTRRETQGGEEVTVATIDQFEDAIGTAYEAPYPSIPMLIAMKLADGETRGRYYSVQTPLDEVDATLSEGGFTGYVELSENVLSGDYYSVYQAGRKMDIAFIGNARRIMTGDDARKRMADEVGIFEVVGVNLNVVEIPEPEPPADDGAATAGVASGRTPEASGGATDAGTDRSGTEEATAGSGDAGVADETDPSGEQEAPGPATDAEGAGATHDQPTTEATVEEAGLADPTATPVGSGGDESGQTSGPAPRPEPESEPTTQGSAADEASGTPTTGAEATDASATAAADRGDEPRAVPSLDPDLSATAGASSEGDRNADGARGDVASGARESHSMAPDAGTPESTGGGAGGTSSDEAAALRAALDDARDDLAEARADLANTRRERDDLAARVEELERELRDREEAGGDGPSVPEAEALAGTNIFVRYASKSNCTVEDVHDGGGNFDELVGNLQLTYHTQFESEGATVDGRPFEAWLESTQRYRFARWAVTTLPFEIRETGAADSMGDLYDALPDVDRIELDGAVGVSDEDGEHDVDFDLVFRNRLGEPLAVATIESSRDPVTESEMGRLVTDASAIVERSETLAGAFYVTSAFFSPEALETARDATSGSLLSRDRRRSYVKISRGRGYHLALVESREETFHLSVPDL